MKKFLMAVLVSASLVSSAFASDGSTINSVVINSFRSDYKTASAVNWTTLGEFTKATFILDNQRMEAYYNADGQLVGTARGLSLDHLPTRAKRTFAKNYDGYIVKEVIRFDGTEEKAYYIFAENEKKSVILKVDDNEQLYTFKKSNK